MENEPGKEEANEAGLKLRPEKNHLVCQQVSSAILQLIITQIKSSSSASRTWLADKTKPTCLHGIKLDVDKGNPYKCTYDFLVYLDYSTYIFSFIDTERARSFHVVFRPIRSTS